MRPERWIIPSFVAAAVATFALIQLMPNPGYPELVGYGRAAFFILVFIVVKFSRTGDVREISLIFFLVPTFILYFSALFFEEFVPGYRQIHSDSDLARATRLAFVGYLAAIAGHYWSRGFASAGTRSGGAGPRPLLTHLRKVEVPREALVRGSLLLMGLSIFFIVFDRQLAPVRQLLGRVSFIIDQLPMLAIALGGMAILRGYRNPFFWTVLFVVFLPINIFIIVARTLFYHLILLLAPLLTMQMLWRRRIPWVWALSAVIILGPAFKSRTAERDKHGWSKMLSAPELVSTGFGRVVEAWKVDDQKVLKSQSRNARQRMNSLSLLAHCVRLHEREEKPYKILATFWGLPLSPIPRIVFPWKPVNDHGLTFGLEYGLLMPGEDFAVVLPLMVESYISGGMLGVIILGFLVGSAYHMCFALFEHGRGSVNLMALMTVVYFIVYVENNITMLFGGAMQAMAMWWVLDRTLGSRAMANGPRPAPAFSGQPKPAPSGSG